MLINVIIHDILLDFVVNPFKRNESQADNKTERHQWRRPLFFFQMTDQSLKSHSMRARTALHPESLPLKKRRACRQFPPDIDLSQSDLLQLTLLSPPQSPHVESIKRKQKTDLSPTSFSLSGRIGGETSQSSPTPSSSQQQQQTDASIDEHFRKSLGENYDRVSRVILTPVEGNWIRPIIKNNDRKGCV